ncbi:hypothetical protein QF002_000945 [Paraburkholderia youngii]
MTVNRNVLAGMFLGGLVLALGACWVTAGHPGEIPNWVKVAIVARWIFCAVAFVGATGLVFSPSRKH